MPGTLIVSHGGIAHELLSAGRRIAGDLPGFAAVTLDWDDDLDSARQKIRSGLEEIDRGDGVLILVDLYGSTPCNAAVSFLKPRQVEIVTGVNLPMVVRLGCLTGSQMPLGEMADWLQDKARGSICRPATMGGTQGSAPCEPAPCGEPGS